MLRRRLKNAVKRSALSLLDRLDTLLDDAPQGAQPIEVDPVVAVAPPAPQPEAAPEPTPVVEEPPDDAVGPALTLQMVQELFDEMVRPALQADGGDITLIKVEQNDVYVRLVGACSSCPSSILTMKMGIERLLHEEFPQMGELVQIDSLF